MKLFTILIALVIFSSFPVFGSGQQDDSSMDKPMMEDKSEMASPLLDFINMEKSMILAESSPTVLFFYANWCPSCQAVEKDITMNASDLEGINLIKVDYDDSKELQKKYGVTSQHTFIQIDPAGEALAKWNGGGSKEILENLVKKEM
jgi:thiol-disulfide isomerase/thioredoxin